MQHSSVINVHAVHPGVSLGAVLSAHSCPRSLLPRETKYSVNFASAYREHTRFSIGSTSSVSISCYIPLFPRTWLLYSPYHIPTTLFILSSSLPHLRGLPPSLSTLSRNPARLFVPPSCAQTCPLVPLCFTECSLSPLSDDSRRESFLLFLSLYLSFSVSLETRVLPPLAFVIVVSSFPTFAWSLTLYASFSQKLSDSRDAISPPFLYFFRSSRTPLSFYAP